MTKKYLKDARARLASRRRAVQAMGSLVGTVILGCGGGDPGGESDATGPDGSTGGTGDGSTAGDVPTTGGPETTSGADATGDESSSTTGSSTTGTDGESSSGDESSSTGEPVDECAGGTELTPEQLLAGIDHVIVLMMENRS